MKNPRAEKDEIKTIRFINICFNGKFRLPGEHTRCDNNNNNNNNIILQAHACAAVKANIYNNILILSVQLL